MKRVNFKKIEIHRNLRSENESKYMVWITHLRNHKTEERFPQLLFWSKSVRYKEVYLSELMKTFLTNIKKAIKMSEKIDSQ